MSISISNNISSLDAQRSLGINQRSLAGNMAHLSSGMRINSAADDAAGEAISEQMESNISSYNQANRNATDGVSMMQVASGAMNQQAQLLTRMKELATEAANGTLGTAQLSDTNTEFQQDIAEVQRIASSTSYNGISMLSAASSVTFQVGTTAATTDQISTTIAATDTTTLGIASLSTTSQSNAQAALTAIDTAIQTLSTAQATVGAGQNRLTAAADNASDFAENLQSAESNIKDVDVASESANMSRNSILVQAGTAVLAQANQLPSAALKLLQG